MRAQPIITPHDLPCHRHRADSGFLTVGRIMEDGAMVAEGRVIGCADVDEIRDGSGERSRRRGAWLRDRHPGTSAIAGRSRRRQ